MRVADLLIVAHEKQSAETGKYQRRVDGVGRVRQAGQHRELCPILDGLAVLERLDVRIRQGVEFVPILFFLAKLICLHQSQLLFAD